MKHTTTIHIDSFSGAVTDLKPGQRTSDNVLAVLAKHPRVSTWDMSEYAWLRARITDLYQRGLVVIDHSEPFPWVRYVLTDAGRAALPNGTWVQAA